MKKLFLASVTLFSFNASFGNPKSLNHLFRKLHVNYILSPSSRNSLANILLNNKKKPYCFCFNTVNLSRIGLMPSSYQDNRFNIQLNNPEVKKKIFQDISFLTNQFKQYYDDDTTCEHNTFGDLLRAYSNLINWIKYYKDHYYLPDFSRRMQEIIERAEVLRITISCVKEASLIGGDFSSIHFDGLILNRIKFMNVNLSKANFSNTHLLGVEFVNSNLTAVNFTNARLISTHLVNSQLEDANLTGSYLQNSNLTHINLTRANLSKCKLISTFFQNINLQEVWLSKAIQLPKYEDQIELLHLWRNAEEREKKLLTPFIRGNIGLKFNDLGLLY